MALTLGMPIEFDIRDMTDLSANLIAECMHLQCDPDRHQYNLLDTFVDYKTIPTALTLDQQTMHNRTTGHKRTKKSTRGWKFCCQWRDGSTSWETLAHLIATHPIQVAEYAVAMNVADQPTFNWWVPNVLKKGEQIISMTKQHNTCYLK
jgi:hypothetical protein